MPRPLTPLAMTVLKLLSEEPLHPYEMQQRIRNRYIDEVVKVTHGALYHTVDRLATTGLIEPVQTSRAGRRPERTVYAITEAGLDQAHDQLRDYIGRLNRDYPAFGMALAFIQMLPPEEVVRLLYRRCVELEGFLSAHGTVMDSLTKQGLPRICLVEIEYALARTRADLEFVRALCDDIENGRLPWHCQQRGRVRNGDR